MNRRQFAAAASERRPAVQLTKMHAPPHLFARDQRPRRSRVAILSAESYSGQAGRIAV